MELVACINSNFTKKLASSGSIIFFFPFLVYRTNMFGGWYMYSVPGGAVLKFVFDIYTWSVVKAVYLDIKFNHLREEE